MENDPLSVKSVAAYLRVDCEDDSIQCLIDAGKAKAEAVTKFDLDNGGERVEYFDYCARLPLPSDDVHWTLEIHRDGKWERQEATQSGDELCVHENCHSCACDPCGGKPKLKLTTKPKSCNAIRSDIVLFVKEYTAYMYMNRGDIDPKKIQGLVMSILGPYRQVAFA